MTGSVTDVLSFAAAHLRDGVGLEGTRVLSAASARAVRRLAVDLTADSTTQRGWGLGWSLVGWGTETSVGHGGGTIGQVLDLTLFPERSLAIAVLTNASTGPALIKELHADLGAELGLTPPTPRVEPTAEGDLMSLVGRWESSMTRWQIAPVDGGRLELTVSTKLDLVDEPDAPPEIIEPTGPGRFLVRLDGNEVEVSHVHADGREYLYLGRLLERTDART